MAKKKRGSGKPQADRQEDAVRDSAKKPEGTQTQTPSPDDKDFHKEALERYERGFLRDRFNQDRAYEDLRFLADEGPGQWDLKARQEREAEGRPILTINKCGQFVRQVTGDMRQMRPAIKCVPVDEAGDKEVADKILPGMIRYIEQRSDAQGTYFAAADQQVAAGIGHWRVTTEYAGYSTFNQEIRISPIEDGIAVVWDPDAMQPDRSDAQFCFVPVDMSRPAFEAKYPNKNWDSLPTVPELFMTWFSDDHVRVAEYWRKVPCKRRLATTPDGAVIDLTDMDEDDAAEVLDAGAEVEERDSYRVQRALISASDVIEPPEDWPGMHIPIVPLIGEEITIGREIYRRGVIRALKDVQRLYNYTISSEAEAVALQPKAPFIGTRTHFERYLDEWETANSRNWPFLQFEIDPKNPAMKPERSPPPLASAGLAELKQTASADMNAVTGIYPAALGAQSNETSGKAILARQREGDTGTYVYVHNFMRSIRRTGQIIVDLSRYIYDTERTIHIVGGDGKMGAMPINKPGVDEQSGLPVTLNDLTIGAYEVQIEMGPSFSTQREEARDGMQALMQALGPQSAMLFTDLFAKMQDWPLADKIAKRAHALLPPPIQALEAQESGEPPPQIPPAPPSPEMQLQMAQHQMEQERLQQETQFKSAQLQLDQQKIEAEMRKAEMELEKARMDHTAAMASHAASVQSAKASAPQPDPRVDDLMAAVQQLQAVVGQIMQAVAGSSPESMPAPSGPPHGAQPASPPPPGGVFIPGATSAPPPQP